ncbi:ribonuclease J [Pseudoroseicyclus tamaricis]|uniref:Ribonuclease J n=1 Tax=Pseudoroseicyclus tamaricis TaxID=2705421 RepID=A0A6B2JSY3_9RHOB|nr:ribonuclease J [Pseudoroseicyclus tamaricis]NDV01667.1 ribonuclease J [Pseudoroseicyclus tamaricis]
MSGERLIYLPLGGAGEIGMNTYVYGYGKPGKERLIVVDLGVTFPDMDGTPGVELILPDLTWLLERRDRIEAIFITHAHMDHIGAVGLLWDKLRAPIYARKFTAQIAREALDEAGAPDSALHIAESWPATIEAGPFRVGFVPISHSIPESSGLVIETAAGRIAHTGDFKIDETPIVGEPFDKVLWSEIGALGVKALLCDSTNVFSPNPGRSEATLKGPITELIREAPGLVAATTFGSNVARLKTLAEAGQAAGRSVVLLGRAMRTMVKAAQDTGILGDFPPVISPEEAADLPRQNLLLLVTGSQGERRAASAQLAQGSYLGLKLQEGDTFLFSSKIIPGNEKGVIKIMNQLSEKGVDVIYGETGTHHVSGHANRPDLEEMHRLVKPEMIVPMHGEHRHLREHRKVAEAGGFPSIIATNGMMLDIGGTRPSVVEFVDAGRTYLDGSVMIGAMDGIVRDRIRMALNGHVLVTLVLDEKDEPIGDPWVDLMGLPETGRSKAGLTEVLEADLAQFVGRANAKTMRSEDKLEKELKGVVRRSANDEIGKKPEVTVVVSRLG